MASLLVRVERGVLDGFLQRAVNQRVELHPDDFALPDLVHLERRDILFVTILERGVLRIAMTVQDATVEDARITDAEGELHDHEITHVLQRLGCPDGQVAEWSAVPRLLPPNDVDLLCYELGLGVGPSRALVVEPSVLAREDEVGAKLLDAVWNAPDADEPRSIYADHLQRREDPRGELIALQLARGDAPPSARERELVAKWGRAQAQPLSRYLEAYELRRGFVSAAIIDDRQGIPEPIIEHPAWSTIRDIQTTKAMLLTRAPLRSLTTLRTDGRTLSTLAASDNTFPFTTLLGAQQPPMRRYRGIEATGLAAWQRVGSSRAFPALRTLSICSENVQGAQFPSMLLHSPLGQQLRHLDVVVDPARADQPPAEGLHAVLGRGFPIERLTLLVAFEWYAPKLLTVGYIKNPGGTFELVIQLHALLGERVASFVRWLEPHAAGIERIELHDMSRPEHTRGRHPELLRRLAALVPTVEPIEAEVAPPALCPWAYTSAPHPSTLATLD